MKAVCSVILGLAVFTLVGSGMAFAMSCHDMSGSKAGHNHTAQGTDPSVESEIIDVGNKICPVTGEQIDGTNKATYKYEDKIYNFCCAGCIEEFNKEPQKYIDKVNAELEAAKAAQ